MAEKKDMNRDPITGEPGSHPVGTGVGGTGGAMAGAAIGAAFGPIGALIGGAIGAAAGGAAGHAAGEAIDPTGETEYWESTYRDRDYVANDAEWNEYHPAYKYGWESKSKYRGRDWDDKLEAELKDGWEKARGSSSLAWEKAKNAVQDGWNRTERTFKTYAATDDYWRDEHKKADYFDDAHDFDSDYAPAYRYGTMARTHDPDRRWDDGLENDLERGWDKVKANSKLGWDKAKDATRDGWHHVERALPGDFDRDGR